MKRQLAQGVILAKFESSAHDTAIRMQSIVVLGCTIPLLTPPSSGAVRQDARKGRIGTGMTPKENGA